MPEAFERTLAAILFTDIVGFTALMAVDEERGSALANVTGRSYCPPWSVTAASRSSCVATSAWRSSRVHSMPSAAYCLFRKRCNS
ncbi:MAG: hypothetical protein JRH16_16280 [Deltaproteobacteria bacterium]|nr:hypothetical protein [Deltaproteobacteria bacterium]MBW2361740.1 hypothetical protein [Deltaproteobacteria bacterium]